MVYAIDKWQNLLLGLIASMALTVPAWGATPQDTKPMLLSMQSIQDASHGGVVAVVTVTSAQLEHAGTRSQQARITAKIERLLHGQAGSDITLVRFSSGTDTVLTLHHSYVVAAINNATYAPALELVEAVEVNPQDNAAIEANLALLTKAAAQ